jgi:hypothetical protein
MVEAAGFEPCAVESPETTEPVQNRAKTIQNSALPDTADPTQKQFRAFPQQNPNKNPHPKCVICVSRGEGPDDLAEVIAAWPHLPQKVKARILAMVKAAW